MRASAFRGTGLRCKMAAGRSTNPHVVSDLDAGYGCGAMTTYPCRDIVGLLLLLVPVVKGLGVGARLTCRLRVVRWHDKQVSSTSGVDEVWYATDA